MFLLELKSFCAFKTFKIHVNEFCCNCLPCIAPQSNIRWKITNPPSTWMGCVKPMWKKSDLTNIIGRVKTSMSIFHDEAAPSSFRTDTYAMSLDSWGESANWQQFNKHQWWLASCWMRANTSSVFHSSAPMICSLSMQDPSSWVTVFHCSFFGEHVKYTTPQV